MISRPRLAFFAVGGVLCLPLTAAPPSPEIMAGLSDESFKGREAAQAALLEWGERKPEQAKDWLFIRSKSDADPEVRRRCLAVLRQLVLEDYLKHGKGYVGILMQSVPVQVPGMPAANFAVRITMVVPGSPAAQAGLVAGGLIVGVNDQVWKEQAAEVAFSQWIQARQPGAKVTLKLLENGKVADHVLELGRRPENAEEPQLFTSPQDAGRMDQESRDRYFKQWLEDRNARK